ncbi:MAG: S41 family peptidase [Allosphingosinicella sp.]
MKKVSRLVSALATMSLLAGCGGGGSGGAVGGGTLTGTTGGGTSGGATGTSCSLRDRQDWALAQLKEWYLFPETLPATLDPTPYSTVDAYIDALTATARAQGKDRFFTYLTSIASENAFFNAGASAGFGVRLAYDTANRRVFVVESFEGTSALAAGIDRGTELLAVGSTASNLQTVSDLMAAGGAQAVVDALGPSTAGTSRALRVTDAAAGTRTVTIAKTDYTLDPVSSRYGASIIDEGGRRFGYVNLRTFIDTADPALRSAFANFRAAGVTDIIVDLRYNGGGLISIAETFGDLMGANRSTSDVFDFVTFRPEKASNNTTRRFQPQPQSIAPTRIAFIGTGGTASASELVINGMLPYYHANEALVGANTYGKPVGQIAVDRSACDDRFRIIALRTENAEHQGDYYAGLATRMDVTCAAGDDYTHRLGDPREASVRQALDFLQGKPCTRIVAGAGGIGAEGAREAPELLAPERPTTAQREVPGLF